MTDILTLRDFWSCYIYDDDKLFSINDIEHQLFREKNASIRIT